MLLRVRAALHSFQPIPVALARVPADHVSVDQTIDWQQLQQRYAGMTDGELQSLAEQAYELTDLARQMLQSELRKRHLSAELNAAPPVPIEVEGNADLDPAELELTNLRRLWSVEEARQAKQILGDARVPSYLGPKHVDDVSEIADFSRGVDLRVRYIDQPRAAAALRELMPVETESGAEEEGDEHLPRCPKCLAADPVFVGREKQNDTEDEFYAKFKWECESCGNEWVDDGLDQ